MQKMLSKKLSGALMLVAVFSALSVHAQDKGLKENYLGADLDFLIPVDTVDR